jgi:hypothetical protein
MMMQKINIRIVSLLLILVFLQKLGGELWVHDWLHVKQESRSLVLAEKGKLVVQNHRIICNCLEDAMMPMVQADSILFEPGSIALTDVFLTHYTSFLSINKEFSSLRGPPAFS